MKVKQFFSASDLDAIEQEVILAEKEVSGEIVPVFVDESNNYNDVMYKAFIIGAFGSALVIIGIDELMGWAELFLLKYHWWFISAMITSGALLALLGRFIPPLRILLAGRQQLNEEVEEAAKKTFLEYELFATRKRTGILIFVSLLERRVQIIADRGINEKISPDDWAKVIADITTMLKQGKKKEAILLGIRDCRDILKRYGFAAGPDDSDELPNHLRRNL